MKDLLSSFFSFSSSVSLSAFSSSFPQLTSSTSSHSSHSYFDFLGKCHPAVSTQQGRSTQLIPRRRPDVEDKRGKTRKATRAGRISKMRCRYKDNTAITITLPRPVTTGFWVAMTTGEGEAVANLPDT